MDSADDNRRSPAGIIVSTPSPHRLLPHRSSIPSSSAMLLPPPLSTAGLAAVKPLRAPALMTSPSPAALHGLHGLAASEAGLLMTASHNGLRSLPPKLTPANPEEVSSKSIPIRCIVEQMGSRAETLNKPPSASMLPPHRSVLRSIGADLDTFAIIPGATLFSNIVRTALLKIGFSPAEAAGAKGDILLKHWRPLTFDSISENPDATVEQILGDVSSIATLRIRLSKSKVMAMEDVKDKLLRFLLHHSQEMLSSFGCPIEKSLLNQLSRGSCSQSLPDDVRDSFNKWFRSQSGMGSADRSLDLGQPLDSNSGRRTPLNGSARLRTSFDVEHEIPRLQKWFAQNHHPSREQMQVYLNELNALESRKGHKLDLANIVYWFKNARAAQRRSGYLGRGENGGRESQGSPDSVDSSDGSADREMEEGRRSPGEDVPVLPNRNAVYVVQPLPPAEDEKIEIVHINEDDGTRESTGQGSSPAGSAEDGARPREKVMGGDVNHNECLTMDVEQQQQQEEATDLSLHRRNSDDSGLHLSHESAASMKLKLNAFPGESAHGMKREREEDMDGDDDDEQYHSSCSSNTSSPRLPTHPMRRDINVKSPALSQPHHLGPHNPHFSPHALHIAAMSQALGMSYLHPASLYGMDASHLASMAGTTYKDDDAHSASSPLDADRKKRSRVFIDPLTEIPKLEKWFLEDTHPSSYMIEKYTEELNRASYRQRFPRLEPKNVQLWFKNHRAKVKRQRLEVPCN